MTRRVSIELVRREFRLSITRTAAAAGACAETPAQSGPAAEPGASQAAECPACASPWFALPAGEGVESAMVQRALEKHGIHTLLLPTGGLLVCGRSFEVHSRAFDVTDAVSTEPRGQEDLPPGKSAGDV